MPCQWMEPEVGSVLCTRNVTVVPSRQRSVGPGTLPLTDVVGLKRPLKFIDVLPNVKSNSVPLKISGPAAFGDPWARLVDGKRDSPEAAATPLTVSP